MVFGCKLVRLLVKLAVYAPSFVFVESEVTGKVLVLHTTPLLVISEPPVELIVPPLFAEDVFISEIAVVVTTGLVASKVLNSTSVP